MVAPRVRTLYKQFLLFQHMYPAKTPTQYTSEVKKRFIKNKDVTGDDLKRAMAWGRYNLKEVETLIMIHKFRYLKREYDGLGRKPEP